MTKMHFKGSAMLNPVPVVLITSKNTDGKINVFTAGWVGTACTRPPMITVAIRPERLSYEYIKNTGEFVVNLPKAQMARKIDFCGVRSGRQIDKLKAMNFTAETSLKVDVPQIAECPVSLECKVSNIIPLGSHDLFIAEVLNVNVEDYLIDKSGKIHLEKADLICYSHGEYFPVPQKSTGKFGYSVKRKAKK